MAFRRSGIDSKRGTLELERKKREELSKDDIFGGRRDDEYKLKESEKNAIQSVLSIYDTQGKGVLDCSQVPDALRALGLNPTLGFVEKIAGSVKQGENQISVEEFIPIFTKCKSDKDSGETSKTAHSSADVLCLGEKQTSLEEFIPINAKCVSDKGEKQISVEEFIPIYAKCKSDKDSGVYEDFIECLKLYDKQENGLIQLTELTHALLSLGERLNDNELDSVLTDCMDPEDDEGFIPYIPFLARMCEKPVPKTIKPL